MSKTVYIGTPEQYFQQTPEPVIANVRAKIVEPVVVTPRLQNGVVPPAPPDYTPIIIAFFGTITVCFLGFLVWMWKQ